MKFKFANIEVFENDNGTLSIIDNIDIYQTGDKGLVVMPIELIPTLIKCLQKVYDEAGGSSKVIEEQSDE